jgi:ankyrin repeat protein
MEIEDMSTTIIHDAVLGQNQLDLAEAIALRPEDVNSFDALGFTPLHWAAVRGDSRAVGTLLKWQADFNKKSVVDKRTPLFLAALTRSLRVCEMLVRQGADVNAANSFGLGPLAAAGIFSENTSFLEWSLVVKFLLMNGADANIPDCSGRNALSRMVADATLRQPTDQALAAKIRLLVANGTDNVATDQYGQTALLTSCSISEDVLCFKTLVELGSSLDTIDISGRSFLHYTAAYGNLDKMEYVRSLDVVGVDPDKKDIYENGNTPMDIMIWRARGSLEHLWDGMRRPTDKEYNLFWQLLKEIRERNWAKGIFLYSRELVSDEDDIQKLLHRAPSDDVTCLCTWPWLT